MTETNVRSAVAYYEAMAAKDLPGMARHLHPSVLLVTPMEELQGKEAVLEAAGRFIHFIEGIEIGAKFGSDDQAMLTYDMNFGGAVGLCRAAALMTFQDGLIVRNEVIFDASPFRKAKDG